VAAMPTGTWAYPAASEPQAAQESPYKDQEEFELATAAQKETDPQKKIDKLKEWEQKYPTSKLADARTLMQAQALLGIAMASYGKTDPALLDSSQKAAQQIVDNLDKYFAPGVKPAQATDQQWADAKHTFELQSHSALGWDAMTKKNDTEAEAQFKKILSISPNEAQISYWLGRVIVGQKNIARYSEAIYDFARAVSITAGPGKTPLDPANKKAAEDYLKKLYSNYHGDESGLDAVKAQVEAAALPPADYHIKSVAEIEKEKFANEEEFNKAHPDIAFWRTLKTALTAPNAATYFEQVKGSLIPTPEINMFKAKIVTVNDKDLVVSVDNAGGDATLKFESALNKKLLNVGDAFEFKAVVDSYTADPYMLTLTVDDPKEMIKGIDEKAFSPAPATKKATPRKTVPKKK
jgi:hypothetical protein